jgi:hypothetical protein
MPPVLAHRARSLVLGKPLPSFRPHALHIKRPGRAAVQAFLDLLPERIGDERLDVARAVDDVEDLNAFGAGAVKDEVLLKA